MKRILLLTVCATLLLLTWECKKVDELTKFSITFHDTVTIPSSTGINLPFNLFTPEVETNSEASFRVNNTTANLVEEIRLKEVHLTLLNPTNGDFSFVNSIRVFISAPEMDETEIAWKESINGEGEKQLILDLTTADLKEYIKKKRMKLRVNTVTDEFLTADHKIAIKSVYAINAKILGQ